MSERSTCCGVKPLRPVLAFLQTAPQVGANRLDHLFMFIDEIGDRLQLPFQNNALPQELQIGKAELQIAGSRHSSARLCRRALSLQRLRIPFPSLIQQSLNLPPIVQSALDLRHQFCRNVNRSTTSLDAAAQYIAQVLFPGLTGAAVLAYAWAAA